jgi:hypothetical protein
MEEFEKFIDGSAKRAAGWIGFYWGRTLEECKKSNEFGDALTRAWLEFFIRRGPAARAGE